MSLSLPTGTATSYPYQFGRVFKQGVIADYPQVLIDGVAQTTQADVKNRWPDGSVKFAILSLIVPSLSTTAKTFTFQNQVTVNSTPETKANMLANYDFNCTINATSGGSPITGAPVAARTILNAISDATLASNTSGDSPNSRYWTQGPICTTVILADHTAKTYDFGTTADKSLRPTFHVQFWPTLAKYNVRVIVEGSDVTKLQDQTYDVLLTTGNSSPATVYTKTTVTQHLGSRWTKSFWSGTAPVDINAVHNSEYLSDCRVIPRYDPLNVPTESQNATAISNWNTTAQDIYDAGYWTKGMQGPGARAEIALFPDWSVLSLTTGDYRRKTIDLKSAELALAWPMHFREGNSAKVYDADTASRSIGSAITLFARPTVQFNNGNTYISGFLYGSQFSDDADRLTFIPPATSAGNGGADSDQHGWGPFWDHCPDGFTPLYLTTGEYIWLEQMEFWASHGSFDGVGYAVQSGGFYGRGATNKGGNLPGDIRRMGWIFRSRVAAAAWSVDGTKQKDYFTYLTNNAITIQEGMQGITGGAYQTLYAADYAWGQTTGRVGRYGNPISGVGISPIRYGDQGSGYAYGYDYLIGYNPSTNGSDSISSRAANFQQGFMLLAVAYAGDLGFAADKLIEWYTYSYTEATKNADTAWIVANFSSPLQYGSYNVQNGNISRTGWIPNYSAVLDCYTTKTYIPNLTPSNPSWPGVTGTPQATSLIEYATSGSANVVGAAAIALIQNRGLPDSLTSWNFFKTNFVDIRPPASVFGSAYFPFNPGWAIIPRP
jgi:hypothetical protein